MLRLKRGFLKQPGIRVRSVEINEERMVLEFGTIMLPAVDLSDKSSEAAKSSVIIPALLCAVISLAGLVFCCTVGQYLEVVAEW